MGSHGAGLRHRHGGKRTGDETGAGLGLIQGGVGAERTESGGRGAACHGELRKGDGLVDCSGPLPSSLLQQGDLLLAREPRGEIFPGHVPSSELANDKERVLVQSSRCAE